MSATTKTAQRAISRQVRALHRQRRDWLAGRGLPWGVPWCAGPGSPYHQEPVCEGCGTAAWCKARAGEIGEQIRHLEASLAPVGPARIVQRKSNVEHHDEVTAAVVAASGLTSTPPCERLVTLDG